MNTILAPLALLLFVVLAITLAHVFPSSRLVAANLGDGISPTGQFNGRADAAFARYSVVKMGSDSKHVTGIAATTDMPLGIATDQGVLAEDPINVFLLGCAPGTMRAVASAAIAATDEIYTTAGVQVQKTPVVTGTYWKIGRALVAASAAGDVITFVPTYPVKLVVP